MNNIRLLLRKELHGYFMTPIAYVFMVTFLLLTGVFTFYFGNFFQRGQADLMPFFSFHPWIYMIFIPAITMRLWSEERKSGSIELLLTLPITVGEAVFSKFLAAWIFTTITLLLTFPMWIIVNYLGNPDNGIIVSGYIGSILMAGGFLSIGACISSLTKNQVIAFIVSVMLFLVFNLAGFPLITEYFQSWVPGVLLDTIVQFGFVTNFDSITKGMLDLRSIVFFISLMTFWLFANVIIIEAKKAD